MGIIILLIQLLLGVYGLGWFIFSFTEPPSSVATYFRGPQAFYFVPEKVARFIMAAICFGLIFAAQLVISFVTRG